jgi:hypothetical protein
MPKGEHADAAHLLATFSKEWVSTCTRWTASWGDAAMRGWLTAVKERSDAGAPVPLWAFLARPWVELGLETQEALIDAYEGHAHAVIDRYKDHVHRQVSAGRRRSREVLGEDALPDHEFPFMAPRAARLGEVRGPEMTGYQ